MQQLIKPSLREQKSTWIALLNQLFSWTVVVFTDEKILQDLTRAGAELGLPRVEARAPPGRVEVERLVRQSGQRVHARLQPCTRLRETNSHHQ